MRTKFKVGDTVYAIPVKKYCKIFQKIKGDTGFVEYLVHNGIEPTVVGYAFTRKELRKYEP